MDYKYLREIESLKQDMRVEEFDKKALKFFECHTALNALDRYPTRFQTSVAAFARTVSPQYSADKLTVSMS